MDPDLDQDPAIFVIDLQDANKKLIKKNSAYYFLKEQLHQSSKIKKSQKKSQNSRIQGFSYFFLLVHGRIRIQIQTVQIMMDPDPGSPKTYGSGSTTLN
jgi:hypothetical protein